MADPTPDTCPTPAVCACGSTRRRKVWADDRSYEFVCGDCGKHWSARPAPGSSSPAVTALVDEIQELVRRRRKHLGPSIEESDRIADALEAQAARITELEADLAEARSMIGRHDPTGVDHMEDAARLAVENDDLRAAIAIHLDHCVGFGINGPRRLRPQSPSRPLPHPRTGWVKHSQWIGRGLIDRALHRTPDPHRWGRPLFTNRQWYQQGYSLIGKENA